MRVVKTDIFRRKIGVDDLFALRRLFIPTLAGDAFEFLLTTIVSFLLVFNLGFSTSVHAEGQPDLQIGSTVRSYPLSGVFETELGYSLYLWADSNSTPWYGYTRIKLAGSSAATYNSGESALELFPLSFLGVRAGGESIQNDKDYSAFDCATYECQGRYYRTFVESELTLGAGPVFIRGIWRRERWTQQHPERKDFIEPTSGLAIANIGDSQTVYIGVLGWSLDENWSLMSVLRYAQSDDRLNSGGMSRFPYVVVKYQLDGLIFGLGGGSFESALKKREASGLAFLRWEIAPSAALK